MDELDKGLQIALTGAAADEALAECRKQLAAWGVTPPPVEPLVLDFGLGRFYDCGLIEYWIANEAEEGYCGKYLFVFDGQTCPAHSHRNKHETFFIVKGLVEMTLDDRSRTMVEGDVLPVSQCSLHTFTGLGPALLLELSKPCVIADNQFQDPAIPIGRRL